jgi:MFS family permease
MNIREAFRSEFSFFTGNYRILVLSWIVMDLAMEMPNPNFQYYVQALGGTGMGVGLIGFANFISMAAVSFPGGYLADKYGRRWIITTMTFGMALSHLILALAPTWEFILFGSIVNSLCLIYQPALFAMFQDALPPKQRGIGSSITQLINSTFNTPGPLIAGVLLLQFGLVSSMRIIYVLMTGLFLIAAVIRLRLKESKVLYMPIRLRRIVSSYPLAVRESIQVWKKVPRSMFWLFIGQTLWMFGFALTQVINALYARDVLLIPESQWWLVYFPLLVTMGITSIPVGKAIDRVGRKKPLYLALVVWGSATLLFINGTFYMVIIAMALFGVAQLLAMSASTALSADLVSSEHRGRINGSINFAGYIAMACGMLFGNYLYINISAQTPFYAMLGLVIPIFLIIRTLVQEPAVRQ